MLLHAAVAQAAPGTSDPNWAAILSGISAFLGLIFLASAAIYARLQHLRSIDRDRKEQASKVAFWGEVIDGRLQLKYINTSGLPIWNVFVSPASSKQLRNTYEAFTLGPVNEPIELDARWRWVDGMMGGTLDMLDLVSRSVGGQSAENAIETFALVTGSGFWKLDTPTAENRSVRMRVALMSATFTDASGERWSRKANGELAPTTSRPALGQRILPTLHWLADGLRGSASDRGRN